MTGQILLHRATCWEHSSIVNRWHGTASSPYEPSPPCRYLQDKDLFERYYKQHLSKRLLVGRVTNDDAEHAMLSKLKTECGYQFTSKLESMFMDIKTSQETMQAFRSHLSEHSIDLAVDINVQVPLPSACAYHTCLLSTLCAACYMRRRSAPYTLFSGSKLQIQHR